MELLEYWKVIRKSLWIILLLVALGTGAIGAYTYAQPYSYESTATILLNPTAGGNLVAGTQADIAANLAGGYSALMRTRAFDEAVAAKLPFSMTAGQVASAIDTQLLDNTLFFQVKSESDTPEHAQQLVKAVLDVFLAGGAGQLATPQPTQTDENVKNDMRDALLDKLAYLRAQITDYESRIATLEDTPASKERDDQLLQLRGQLVALQQTETETMVGLAEIGDKTTAPTTATVVDPPLPGKRMSTGMVTNVGLALAASLVLGLVVAFVRYYMDYTVHTLQQLEDVLGLPPAGAVGLVGRRRRGYPYPKEARRYGRGNSQLSALAHRLVGHKLITLESPRSPESESFRALRTNLQFSSLDRPPKRVLVTSSTTGEGKTFVAANLAIVMAQAGNNVILVDADLRNPTVHKIFQLSNSVGFTSLFLSDSSPSEVGLNSIPEVPTLAVMPSGPEPANPSEVLNSPRASHVMNLLAKRFDTVIYDSPPAGLVTDPVILARQVDAVVLVVAARSTRIDLLLRVKQMLQQVSTTIILPVLNRMPRDLDGYEHYVGRYEKPYGSGKKSEVDVQFESNPPPPSQMSQSN